MAALKKGPRSQQSDIQYNGRQKLPCKRLNNHGRPYWLLAEIQHEWICPQCRPIKVRHSNPMVTLLRIEIPWQLLAGGSIHPLLISILMLVSDWSWQGGIDTWPCFWPFTSYIAPPPLLLESGIVIKSIYLKNRYKFNKFQFWYRYHRHCLCIYSVSDRYCKPLLMTSSNP